MARLTSQLLVSALLRRIEGAGGFAMVLHKGESNSGVMLVQLLERGRYIGLRERMTDLDGHQTMVPVGPLTDDQPSEIKDYIERRRRSDPDLWVVELDIAEGERFAAETLCTS